MTVIHLKHNPRRGYNEHTPKLNEGEKPIDTLQKVLPKWQSEET